MGNNFLKAPITEKHCEDVSSKRFRVGVASMQGWRVDMEDAHVIKTEDDNGGTAFFGVFDGHCGDEVAKYCEQNWVDAVMSSAKFETNLPGAMRDSFFRLDEQLLDPVKYKTFALEQRGKQELETRKSKRQESRVDLQREVRARLDNGISKGSLSSNEAFELAEIMQELAAKQQDEDSCEASTKDFPPSRTRAGCTAVCAAVRGNKLIVANAGDSRAVICRKDGKVVACSEDHKPNNRVEKERISKAGGWVSEENRVNGQLALSRAIGDFDFKQCKSLSAAEQAVTCDPDVTEFDLEPGDEFLILACDGIWDVLTNEECVEFIRAGLLLQQSKEEEGGISSVLCTLLEKCLAPSAIGLGTDNMTCLVVQLKDYYPS